MLARSSSDNSVIQIMRFRIDETRTTKTDLESPVQSPRRVLRSLLQVLCHVLFARPQLLLVPV